MPEATAFDPSIFKSYDVRGIYPAQLGDGVAYRIGRAFVDEFGMRNIVIGRDMRESGQRLYDAFARGATEGGCNVTYVGLVSTDALYFAVGKYGFDGGVMITASHNPADYNGMKFTRGEAQALSLDTGLSGVRDRVARGEAPAPVAARGTVQTRGVLGDFAKHCISFITDPAKIKPFKIAVDAGNGMAGETIPYVFRHLPCKLVPLYFE